MTRSEHRRETERDGRIASQAGFSLIEILVVLLIMGLLAAIAIPRFLVVQNKAHDADAKASAGLAALAMETYATDHDGYENAMVADLEEIEPLLVDAPALAIDSSSSDDYELHTVSTSNPATTFIVRRASTGGTLRTCSPAGGGGCPASGGW